MITSSTKRVAIAAFAAVLASTAVAQQSGPPPRNFDYWQPGWMMRELWGPGRMSKSMSVRMLRHNTYMQAGVPADYAGAHSPLKPDQADISSGSELFAKNCASCHGKDGMGGGVAGNSLVPSPALLAFMINRPIAVDEYMLWVVSDGGKQFDSAMPAFKGKLARDDIWRVIAYMRAGFPQPVTAAPPDKK